MICAVFDVICSVFMALSMMEIAALLYVSVHEVFSKKREQLRDYYRNKRNKR